MEVSISYCICAEVSEDGDIWTNQRGYRDNILETVSAKDVGIIEARACPDHIHMLISIPPKYSVSQIMGYLKGKSSLMIFDRHANLKY